MKTFAEMGWHPWTGVLMIYGYSVFLILLWARYAPVQRERRPCDVGIGLTGAAMTDDLEGLVWADHDYPARERKPAVCPKCRGDMILRHPCVTDIERVSQAIWQEYVASVGVSLPAGLADRMAQAAIAALARQEQP